MQKEICRSMIDKGKHTECNDFKDPWRKSGND